MAPFHWRNCYADVHPLKFDPKGFWCVSNTGNWQVTFRIESDESYDGDLVDCH